MYQPSYDKKTTMGKIRRIGDAWEIHLGQICMENIHNGFDVLPHNEAFWLFNCNVEMKKIHRTNQTINLFHSIICMFLQLGSQILKFHLFYYRSSGWFATFSKQSMFFFKAYKIYGASVGKNWISIEIFIGGKYTGLVTGFRFPGSLFMICSRKPDRYRFGRHLPGSGLVVHSTAGRVGTLNLAHNLQFHYNI